MSKGAPLKVSTFAKPVNRVLEKITLWQQQLRETMAGLIESSKATGSLRPLMSLILLAFGYGVLHAAGPGHGKAIALSYIVSRGREFKTVILFGNLVALSHGLSGIVFVLLIRFILQTSVTRTVGQVTNVTKIISLSLIACIGIGIMIKSVYSWRKETKTKQFIPNRESEIKHKGPLATALVLGMVPCSGVVMVMLFALSMNLIGLGVLLGISISLGMAVTITAVVVIGVAGKRFSFGLLAKRRGLGVKIEYLTEAIAGLVVTILAVLFLATTA